MNQRPSLPAKHTTLSTRGQVVLPKSLRNARKWAPGRRFEIVETPDGVLLRAEPLFPPKTIDEVAGSLKYDGPPITLEDMERAIEESVMEQYRLGRY